MAVVLRDELKKNRCEFKRDQVCKYSAEAVLLIGKESNEHYEKTYIRLYG